MGPEMSVASDFLNAVTVAGQIVRVVLDAIPDDSAAKLPVVSALRDFWGKNIPGPMPPDLDAWTEVNNRIDRLRGKVSDR